MDSNHEELLIEMLERERRFEIILNNTIETKYIFEFNREWHDERSKLVHCIHIQQLELMQRAAASHERAGEIAKVSRYSYELLITGFILILVNMDIRNLQRQ